MYDVIEITGGVPLNGLVRVSGAKNAALPLLFASLLTAQECVYENVPALEDITITLRLLEQCGAEVAFNQGRLHVRVPQLISSEAGYSLVKSLRASFWVLAPLLARGGTARVALPGGDLIGARPVDMHIEALVKMGAEVRIKHGVVYATAVSGLKSAHIELRFPSVGATHQIIMAAALVPGSTVIDGAAREPEVVALADMINSMGGDIEGAGTSQIVVRGQESLGGAKVRLIGDRIEAGTFLYAAAATGGRVTVEGFDPRYLARALDVLSDIGLNVSTTDDSVSVERSGDLKPVNISTGPFPEFATDLQAPLMALIGLAPGVSTVEENVFEGRFGHVSELCRLGLDIRVQERQAVITGVSKYTGAQVEAHDIRAGAALIIAGLAAEGMTFISEPHHIRRGYERVAAKFSALGARMRFAIEDPEDMVMTGC